MLLKILIKNLPKEKKKIKVKGLAINSKKVKKDFIFFAIKGYKSNGEKFIKEAIKRGASVIICSKNCKYKNTLFFTGSLWELPGASGEEAACIVFYHRDPIAKVRKYRVLQWRQSGLCKNTP